MAGEAYHHGWSLLVIVYHPSVVFAAEAAVSVLDIIQAI
jgi:hypothetical protein